MKLEAAAAWAAANLMALEAFDRLTGDVERASEELRKVRGRTVRLDGEIESASQAFTTTTDGSALPGERRSALIKELGLTDGEVNRMVDLARLIGSRFGDREDEFDRAQAALEAEEDGELQAMHRRRVQACRESMQALEARFSIDRNELRAMVEAVEEGAAVRQRARERFICGLNLEVGEVKLAQEIEAGEREIFVAIAGNADLMFRFLATIELAARKDATPLPQLVETENVFSLLDREDRERVFGRASVLGRLRELEREHERARSRARRLQERIERKTVERDRLEEVAGDLEEQVAQATAERAAVLNGVYSSTQGSLPVLRFSRCDWLRLLGILDLPPTMCGRKGYTAATVCAQVRTWALSSRSTDGQTGARQAVADKARDRVALRGRRSPEQPGEDCLELLAAGLGRLASGSRAARNLVADLLVRVWEAAHVEDAERPPPTPSEPPPGADGAPAGVDLAPPGGEEAPSSPLPPVRRPVAEIGGRRDRVLASSATPSGPSGPRVPPSRRAELICRRCDEDWGFTLALAVPEDSDVQEVLLNGDELELQDGECRTPACTGALQVRASGGDEFDVPLFTGRPLVFRTGADWSGTGRRVRGVGRGHFLVVAPEDWRRTDEPPVEPEPCGAGFLAHYFFFDDVETLDGPVGFDEAALGSVGPGFTLNGVRAFDDSADGDLFRTIPSLSLASGAREVRVGSEGERWWPGETFDPEEKSLEDVLGDRQGRFYVRVYDDSGLRDTGQFRLLRELRGVRVDGKEYTRDTVLLPGRTGHRDVTVELLVADEGRVRAVQSVRCRPDPGDEQAVCRTPTPSGEVRVEVRPPRVWWRLTGKEGAADGWKDVRLERKRQDFQRFCDEGVHVEVRLPPSVREVRAGFDSTRRRYRALLAGRWRQVRAPLRDFRDYVAVSRPAAKGRALQVRLGDNVIEPLRIWDEAPPPAWLQPRPGVWRKVGYTLPELELVGMTAAEVQRLKITVDKARSTVDQDNVDRLQGWLDAQRT